MTESPGPSMAPASSRSKTACPSRGRAAGAREAQGLARLARPCSVAIQTDLANRKDDVRRPLLPLAILAAVYVLATGGIHLREWAETYRYVPADAPGGWVVRAGFPLQAVVAALLAGTLVAAALKWTGGIGLGGVAVAGILFEAASLTALLLSRRSGVFGWTEEGWSNGPSQTLAVELGALALLGLLGLVALPRRTARVASGPWS